MVELAVYTAMLKAVTSVIPSAIMAIDANHKVTNALISKNIKVSSTCFHGQKFFRILKMVFGTDNASFIYSVYQECLNTKKATEIVKQKHISSRGLVEYLNWRFTPVIECDGIIVLVRNITEHVLIEEEFTSMSEQYESVNRELCVAMSKLDFHLMDIEQAHKKVAALYRITSIVQRTVNEQEVFDEILDGIIRELGFSNVGIMILDEETSELEITAARGMGNRDVRIPMGIGITGYAAKNRELVYVEDVHNDDRYIDGGTDCTSEVAVPLVIHDKVLGVLNIDIENGRSLPSYDLDLLRSLASQIAMTIAHASHVVQVEMQAITDGLTGLYNYRYFRTILDQELKRAARYKRPLALLMIDVDHFKNYNDQNGHRLGDEALCSVAYVISQCCRDVDFVVRYGGEEFAVLLPETNTDEACKIADRIRLAVADYPFPNRASQPGGLLTISVGAASYPNDAEVTLELIDHADTALYKAKKFRNCICSYSSSGGG